MKKTKAALLDLEFRIELLKERIYATLAVLAVLLTIDAHHTSPSKAAIIVAGTAVSLWIASLVAGKMSYRIVMRQPNLDRPRLDKQAAQHSQLLMAAVFPLLLILLSMAHIISLALAVNIGIGVLVLLLCGWSLMSARAIHASKVAIVITAAIELAIGFGIVWLKIAVGH